MIETEWVDGCLGEIGALLVAGYACLDPEKQGVCWPDPVGFDGRPHAEQARDLCAVLDAHGSPYAEYLAEALTRHYRRIDHARNSR